MSDERLIEEVRPKILATGTSNMNMYHSINEGELTNPNVGMTHYKGNQYLLCTTQFDVLLFCYSFNSSTLNN
jgi:hypothetical protein